jgi:hypothetical protein
MLAHQGCSVSNTIKTTMKVTETTTKTIDSKTETVVEFVTAAVADAEEAMESVVMMVKIVNAFKDGAVAIGMVVVAEVVDGDAAAALNEPAVGMLNPRLAKHTWKSTNL